MSEQQERVERIRVGLSEVRRLFRLDRESNRPMYRALLMLLDEMAALSIGLVEEPVEDSNPGSVSALEQVALRAWELMAEWGELDDAREGSIVEVPAEAMVALRDALRAARP